MGSQVAPIKATLSPSGLQGVLLVFPPMIPSWALGPYGPCPMLSTAVHGQKTKTALPGGTASAPQTLSNTNCRLPPGSLLGPGPSGSESSEQQRTALQKKGENNGNPKEEPMKALGCPWAQSWLSKLRRYLQCFFHKQFLLGFSGSGLI